MTTTSRKGPTSLQVGDRVLVTLRLSVRERAHYMVIDDPAAIIDTPKPSIPEFRTAGSSVEQN